MDTQHDSHHAKLFTFSIIARTIATNNTSAARNLASRSEVVTVYINICGDQLSLAILANSRKCLGAWSKDLSVKINMEMRWEQADDQDRSAPKGAKPASGRHGSRVAALLRLIKLWLPQHARASLSGIILGSPLPTHRHRRSWSDCCSCLILGHHFQ